MSFLAKLNLGENTYIVLTADYEVSQPIGRRNMPTDAPFIGLIHLSIESDNKSEIFEWATGPKLAKSGSIVFFRRDALSTMKTLSFKDGFCVGFKEQFDADSEKPMIMHLTLTVRELSCQGVVLDADWPGFDGQESSGSSTASSPQTNDSGAIPSFIP